MYDESEGLSLPAAAVEDKWPEKAKASSYKLGEVISKTKSITICKAVCLTKNTLCIVKIFGYIKRNTDMWKQAVTEIELVGVFNHRNVVRNYTSFEGEKYTVWVVMEYVVPLDMFLAEPLATDKICEGCEMSEDVIATIIKQVLVGLNHIHSKGFIHCQLKPSSIFITSDGTVKVGNFGSFVPKSSQLDHVEKADIWNIGCMALKLATGNNVSASNDEFEAALILVSIAGNTPTLESLGAKFHDSFSTNYNSFVRQCLSFDPTERPSSKELLKHSFINTAPAGKYLIGPLKLKERAVNKSSKPELHYWTSTSDESDSSE